MEAGKHGFDGSCIPTQDSHWETFSVGIFEWLAKKNGPGLKRGKVKVRVSGSTKTPELVIAKAKEIASQLDSGEYKGEKEVKL